MHDYKEDFPLLCGSSLSYLDHAATAQRPACVLRAEQDFYTHFNANPLRGIYSLGVEATDRYEHARETVRAFLHAGSSDEIIFTRNTTESINLTAYSYGLTHLKSGDEILVTITEHHSNILPWQMAARQTGATLKYLDCEADGSYTRESLDRAITPRTKIAAIGQVSNVLGSVNPVEEIIKRVHKVGGIVVVDGAQSTPHFKIDVTEMDADFFAFSGHKLMAPMGIGVLYGKKKLLEEMPPFLTGGEMIDSVTRQGAVYAPVPHKFEAGTVNAGGAVALERAILYMNEIGLDTIGAEEKERMQLLFGEMQQIPHIHILGSRSAAEHHGIVSFTVDDVHPHDIASIMDEADVAIRAGHHCAQPLLQHLGVMVSARASIAFYNTEEDIWKFIKTLKTVRERMGYGK